MQVLVSVHESYLSYMTHPWILVPSLHQLRLSFDHSIDLALRMAGKLHFKVSNDRFLPLGLVYVLLGAPCIFDDAG